MREGAEARGSEKPKKKHLSERGTFESERNSNRNKKLMGFEGVLTFKGLDNDNNDKQKKRRRHE